MTRGARATVSFAVLVALVAAATLIVKGAYGAFSGNYELNGLFVRAGEGLHQQSQVEYRGVTVGSVRSITLQGGRADVVIGLQPGFRVPTDAVATIQPKNVFGEEVVELRFPHGEQAPFLAPGQTIAATAVSPELTQLLSAADPLLKQINGQDLATVISELSVASAGEGPKVAASIDEGARLAGLLDSTLDAQLRALDSFTRFNQALAPAGPSFNAIADNNNLSLPVFNARAAAYQKVLDNFTPVANELARYLSAYHPDITALLTAGDNVVRVLIARQQDIANLIHGLYRYTYKFASGASPETLPNGTKFAYFKTFVLFSDVNQLVCDMIAPAQPGLGFLQPLQQALTGPGSPFNCSAQMAAFRAAQSSAAPARAATAPAPSATGPASSAAQNLLNQLQQTLGRPQGGRGGGLATVIAPLLGAGS